MADFGPEYPKIQSLWMRDNKGVIDPNFFSVMEFEYLFNTPWAWTEKVDGTNIRLHFDGDKVSINGRTDNSQIPAKLIQNLSMTLFDSELWRKAFPDCDNVTVYGEGYGAGIQSGDDYSPNQDLVIFDVLVDKWWLRRQDITDVGAKLGLEVVPFFGVFSLADAWQAIKDQVYSSWWPDASIEGLVGKPTVDLFDRRGNRIIVKLKHKDWLGYQQKHE